jgi:glycosyltransferase involved in cell wall biosynthesis
VTTGRPGLSVAVITLNEERNIAACLDSVKWADEVVVCDSGSQDRTVEIAASHGARTFHDPWRGFAGHKNLAVERCRHEWVLVLDADERVPEALRQEIEGVLRSAGPADGYSIGRRNHFLGAWIRHGGWYPDRSVRLFRNGRGRFQPRAVHETVEVAGTVGTLRESLGHHTYASVQEFLQRMARYADLAAEEMHAAGKRCGVIDLTLRPVWTVLRMYVFQRGFLDGWRGLLLAGLYACYTLAKYAALWERERRPARG